MFIPLYDGVALRFVKKPYATYAIILLNCSIALALWLGLLGNEARFDAEFGVIPAVLTGRADLDPALAVVAPALTALTSTFVHAGFLHLASNMIFLWVFGDNVEDAMGSTRFVIFYLLCGAAGSSAYALMLPQSDAPLIGASGAISGVVAAYLMLYPRARVFGLVFDWLPLRLPAIYCVGLWIAVQIGGAVFGANPEVGWWTHVGGIAAGLALTPLLKRNGVRLFGRQAA